MAVINFDAKWKTPILENCFHAHDGAVKSISFNNTGKQLASGGDDGIFKIWNFKENATRTYIFNDQKGPITCVCFSPDGSVVASVAGTSATIRTPERQTRSYSFRPHTLAKLCVDFSPDSGFLITCSEDKTIKKWDTGGSSCRFLCTFSGHKNWVRWASFSPDGRRIASASDDATVKIWDSVNRRSICTLPYSHFDAAFCVKFHPNDWLVGACGKDMHVRVWDVRNRGLLHSFAEHSQTVTSIDFHCDGDFMCSSGLDGTVKVYSLTENRIVYTLHGHESPVHSVQFSRQGDLLASSDDKGQIFFWRTNFR